MKGRRKPAAPKAVEELVQAAIDGDTESIDRLLDAGADIDAHGRNWNALHSAIEHENLACVRLLVRRGAALERPGGGLTPLAHAVDIAIDGALQTGAHPGDEQTEIVDLLLAAGADPAPGLAVARAYGSTKLIDLLAAALKHARPRRPIR